LRVHITNNSPATLARTGTTIGSWSLSQLNAYLAPDRHVLPIRRRITASISKKPIHNVKQTGARHTRALVPIM
jgi:hypothetical protein